MDVVDVGFVVKLENEIPAQSKSESESSMNQNCWLCHAHASSLTMTMRQNFYGSGPLMQNLLSSLYNYEFPTATGSGTDDKENTVICCMTCALSLTNLNKTRIQILKNVHPNARLRVDGHVKKMLEKSKILGTTGTKKKKNRMVIAPIRVSLPEVIKVEESDTTDSSGEPWLKPKIPHEKVLAPDPRDLENSPEPEPAPDDSETKDDDEEFQLSNPPPPRNSSSISQLPKNKRTRDRLLLTGRCNRSKCQHSFSKCPRSTIYRHLQTAHSEEVIPEFYCSDSECSKKSFKLIKHADFDAHFFRNHAQGSTEIPPSSSFPKLMSRCGLEFKIDFKNRRKRKDIKKSNNSCCSICKESWMSQAPGTTLRFHMEMVHGQDPKYSCPICGMPVKNQSHLEYHLKTHRGADEKKRDFELNEGKEKEMVPCEYCGIVLNKQSVQIHVDRIHAPETNGQRKTYTCEICNKIYFCPRYLKKHTENAHSAQPKPIYYYKFTCSRCNEGFVLRRDLAHHKLSCCDEKERPFPCAHCPKRFKIKPNLSKHLLDMHKMDRVEVRELLYPGLPVPEWWGMTSYKRKASGDDVGADGSNFNSKLPRNKRKQKKKPGT